MTRRERNRKFGRAMDFLAKNYPDLEADIAWKIRALRAEAAEARKKIERT